MHRHFSSTCTLIPTALNCPKLAAAQACHAPRLQLGLPGIQSPKAPNDLTKTCKDQDPFRSKAPCPSQLPKCDPLENVGSDDAPRPQAEQRTFVQASKIEDCANAASTNHSTLGCTGQWSWRKLIGPQPVTPSNLALVKMQAALATVSKLCRVYAAS